MNDIKETAKEIRTVLKAAFSVTKFSVKCHQFSQGETVAIAWTDGPAKNQVEPLVNGYGDGYSRFIRISRRQSAVNVSDDVANWVESYTLSAPELVEVQAETAPQLQESTTSANDQLTELVALQKLLISKVEEVNKLKLKIAELQVAADTTKYSQRQPALLVAVTPQPKVFEAIKKEVSERFPTPEEQRTDEVAKKFSEGWEKWNVFDTGYFLKYKRPYPLTKKQVDWLRSVYVKQFKWGESRDKACDHPSMDNMGSTYQREFMWQVSVHKNGSGTFEILVKK